MGWRAVDAAVKAYVVAPQGFEPRLSESESLVLPLNEGAICRDGAAASRKLECLPLPLRVYCVRGFGSIRGQVLARV
jgi:hypothetical protein